MEPWQPVPRYWVSLRFFSCLRSVIYDHGSWETGLTDRNLRRYRILPFVDALTHLAYHLAIYNYLHTFQWYRWYGTCWPLQESWPADGVRRYVNRSCITNNRSSRNCATGPGLSGGYSISLRDVCSCRVQKTVVRKSSVLTYLCIARQVSHYTTLLGCREELHRKIWEKPIEK